MQNVHLGFHSSHINLFNTSTCLHIKKIKLSKCSFYPPTNKKICPNFIIKILFTHKLHKKSIHTLKICPLIEASSCDATMQVSYEGVTDGLLRSGEAFAVDET